MLRQGLHLTHLSFLVTCTECFFNEYVLSHLDLYLNKWYISQHIQESTSTSQIPRGYYQGVSSLFPSSLWVLESSPLNTQHRKYFFPYAQRTGLGKIPFIGSNEFTYQGLIWKSWETLFYGADLVKQKSAPQEDWKDL